jgi:hypothetical protein
MMQLVVVAAVVLRQVQMAVDSLKDIMMVGGMHGLHLQQADLMSLHADLSIQIVIVLDIKPDTR